MKISQLKTKYHTLALSFQYNPQLVAICQIVKNKIGWRNFSFDKDNKVWGFNIENFEEIVKHFPGVEYSNEITELFVKYHKEKKEENAKASIAYEQVEVSGLPLFEYQKIGVNFASVYDKVFIADEMGLGKTIQALGVIKNLNLQHVLIVCPASLKSNWAAEIKKWNIGRPVIVEKEIELENKNNDLFTTDISERVIHIVNYERLGKIEGEKIKWELIVFDECHYLKNNAAKRTEYAKQYAKSAKKVIMLSGTPILNRPYELISQITILGKMKEFGTSWEFMQKYCAPETDSYGHTSYKGASNLEDLKQKLQKFTLRRTKDEVLKDLPDKLVHSTYLDMVEPEAYKKIQEGIFSSLQESKQNYKEFYSAMAGMDEYQRASYLDGLVHNDEYKSLSANALVMIEKLKQESARQKLLSIKDILDEFVQNNIKVVIFGTHKKTIETLSTMYPQNVSMTANTAIDQRQSLVDKFQNDPKTLFFFGTIKTAGVGYTLTSANHVIFVELDWTPTIHQQAEDRCYRIGQKNNVDVNYLLLKDSIDEDIMELLLNKSQVIEGAIKGKVLSKILARNL